MKRMRTIGLALTVLVIGVCAVVIWSGLKRPMIAADTSPKPSVPSPLPAPSTSESAAVLIPVVADAGPSPECAALEAHNQSVLARAKGDGGFNLYGPEVDCVTTRAGVTWGYRVTHVARDITVGSTTIAVELVRQDRMGAHAIVGSHVDLTYVDYYTKRNSMTLIALGDYDGDGEEEILRMHDSLEREGQPEHEASVLTFTSGKLAPYAPAAAIAIEGAEDVDGDGKLDLLTRAPYDDITTASAFGNYWPALRTPLFVAHALPNGTFSTTDPTAVAYTRRQCPTRPSVTFTRQDTTFANSDDVPKQIVCARLWGAPESEVVKAWDAACPSDASSDPYSCQSWPTDLASITPPFTLR